MGSWFSNIHIRKGETTGQNAVAEAVMKLLGGKGYYPVPTVDDADGSVVILSDEHSGWFSVYSEFLTFEMPERFAEIATPISKELQTDVLGISCFDSDYLYLNLINTGSKTNAWVSIGSAAEYGIRRRTNLSAWEANVEHFPDFSAYAKRRYIFAEEFLAKAEQCLALPQIYSTAGWDDLQESGLNEQATNLYFKRSDKPSDSEGSRAQGEKPRLNLEIEGDWGKPCEPETKSTIYLTNAGGGAKGLSIYFTGPYVKNDELTFSDATLWRWKGDDLESHPFELQKICMPDGKWAYYYHDPDYEILPKLGAIDRRLPLKQQLQMDRDQYIIFTFVPHGNGRKALDVTIVFTPDENPEGKASWNVWKGRGFKSKKAYFDFHKALPDGFGFWKLRREDYD